MLILDKNLKNPCWFSEPSACCSAFPSLYENEFSTAEANHYNSVASRHSENHQAINHKNRFALRFACFLSPTDGTDIR